MPQDIACKISRLELQRAQIRLLELENKIDRIKKLLKDTEADIDNKSGTLKKVRLMSQFAEFVCLNEHYADTLEMISNGSETNGVMVNELCQTIDTGLSRAEVAMELLRELSLSH